MLDVCFVNLVEKVLDSFVVFDVMHHDEPHLAGCYERRHEPLVELVN